MGQNTLVWQRIGSDQMQETSYKKSFLIACLINCIFFLALGFSATFVSKKPAKKTTKTEYTMIDLDMDKYKVQGSNPDKPIGLPGGGGGGTKGMGDGDGKGNNGTDERIQSNSTPYAGGYEMSDVGATDAMTQGSLKAGPAQRAFGEGGGGEGDGTGGSGGGYGKGDGGGVGNGTGGGHGYVDLSGYLSKLNQIKTYPQQAIIRGISGKVVYRVTFAASGKVQSIELVSSSGSSILDNAGRRLIESGGRIFNTTKKPTTEIIPIVYEFEDDE